MPTTPSTAWPAGCSPPTSRRAERVARAVRTGTMWINNYHVFAEYCPFGGYKQSGVGRELGHWGLEEYTQIKRIHVPYYSDRQHQLPLHPPEGRQEDRGLQLQLPHQRGRRPRQPVLDLQTGRGPGLPPGADPHRSRGQEGRTRRSCEERPRRLLCGHLRQHPAGPRSRVRGRSHCRGPRAQGGLHRQCRRRQRHRCRQSGLRYLEERRQGQRLHQSLVCAY